METLVYRLKEKQREVPIIIGESLLASKDLPKMCLKQSSTVVLITDEIIDTLYGVKLKEHLTSYGLTVQLITVPPGENSKTRKSKQMIEDQMLDNGIGRDTVVIGLGGGVITDLAGFVAATYCRGVPLVLCPTSLLAMVDASIGGKCGVNTSHGKNLIGSIVQPEAIFIDTKTLETLPQNEWGNGVVEMIKHGAIYDADLFARLEKISIEDHAAIVKALIPSCRVKIAVVEEDEKEHGMRRILNFGHTVGHAIEYLTDYAVPHGAAVALGAIIEGEVAKELGVLSESDFERLKGAFTPYCPESIGPLSARNLIEAMGLDKKALKQSPRIVILERIGQVAPCNGQWCRSVDVDILEETLNDLSRH